MLSLCILIQRGMRVTPSECCRRKTPNLEKTTFSVLSVLILIYGRCGCVKYRKCGK